MATGIEDGMGGPYDHIFLFLVVHLQISNALSIQQPKIERRITSAHVRKKNGIRNPASAIRNYQLSVYRNWQRMEALTMTQDTPAGIKEKTAVGGKTHFVQYGRIFSFKRTINVPLINVVMQL